MKQALIIALLIAGITGTLLLIADKAAFAGMGVHYTPDFRTR